MAFAADGNFCAFRGRVRKVLFNLFDTGHVDQRALLGFTFEAVADGHRRDGFAELGNEIVIHAGLHIDSVCTDAGLTGIAVFRRHRAGDRCIQVGIVKDDERRVTAKFHGYFFHRIGALLHQDFADFSRAGEGQLADNRVAGHFAADFAGSAGDHVDDALRHAGALSQFCHR